MELRPISTDNIVPFYRHTAQSGVALGARNAYARILPRSARGAGNAYARIVPGATASQSWNLYNEQATLSARIPIPILGSNSIGNRCREGGDPASSLDLLQSPGSRPGALVRPS